MFCYNTAVNSAMAFSLYFLMTGQVASSNIDLYMPDCDDNGEFSVAQFTNDTANLLVKLMKAHVSKALKTTSEKRFSEWYNCGDKVRVYNPRKFCGKSTKWQTTSVMLPHSKHA